MEDATDLLISVQFVLLLCMPVRHSVYPPRVQRVSRFFRRGQTCWGKIASFPQTALR